MKSGPRLTWRPPWALFLLAMTGCPSATAPRAGVVARKGGSDSAALENRADLAPDPGSEETSEVPAPTETVTIRLLADARRAARVYWGRKDLGLAPLDVKRPRGSGPLDLVVVAPGYLPLHTRAFTDRNETLALRLYTEKEAASLLGWRPALTATGSSTVPMTGLKSNKIGPKMGQKTTNALQKN